MDGRGTLFHPAPARGALWVLRVWEGWVRELVKAGLSAHLRYWVQDSTHAGTEQRDLNTGQILQISKFMQTYIRHPWCEAFSRCSEDRGLFERE